MIVHAPLSPFDRIKAHRAESPPTPRETYVILGRHGDIVNILPVLRDQAIKSGSPVRVVVSAECAPLFDGTSYIDPVSLDLTTEKLAEAEEFARRKYGVIRTVQVWGNGAARSYSLSHYNQDAWLMAGRINDFKREDMMPVFDQRSPAGEEKLTGMIWGRGKPLMLLALRGGFSSPFKEYRVVQDGIVAAWKDVFDIVDLDLVRCRRIYDLVGLMDRASVLVTSDSVHMHLAAASRVAVIALLSGRNLWAETMPRCGTMWRGNYQEALRSIHKINGTIGLRSSAQIDEPDQVLIHVTDCNYRIKPDEPRHQKAFRSWLEAGWLECHLPEPAIRNARSIGGTRSLPFLKDMLRLGLERCRPQDAVVWTNSDTVVDRAVTGAIWKALEKSHMVTSRRVDYVSGKAHWGRDLCAFQASWLKEHWLEIPDFLCGAAELDNWMALESRRINGIKSTAREIAADVHPADLNSGYVRHLAHGMPEWDKPEIRYSDAANLYNLRLLRDWCRATGSRLQFDSSGNVNWKI